MTHLTDLSATHALDRFADGHTAMRAENKSPGTVAVCTDGTTRYLRWCTVRAGQRKWRHGGRRVDWRLALREVARVSRPGGTFVATTSTEHGWRRGSASRTDRRTA